MALSNRKTPVIDRTFRRGALSASVLAIAFALAAVTLAACQESTASENASGGSGGGESCTPGRVTPCNCPDGSQGMMECVNGVYGACTNCQQSTAGSAPAGSGGAPMAGVGGTIAGGTGGAAGETGGTGGSALPVAGSDASSREKPLTCAGLAGMELTVCHAQLNDRIPMGCENLTGDALAQCCATVANELMDSVALAEYYPECAVAPPGTEPQVGVCTLEESAILDPKATGNPVSTCFFGPDGPAGSQGCDAQHGALVDVAALSRCMPDCLVPATGVSQACADCFGQAQVQVNTICYQSGQCSPIDLVCTVSCIGTTFTEEYDKCLSRE